MIRNAELHDLFQIIELEKKVFKEPLTKEFIYQELTLNPFSYYLVLEINKEIIGYIGFRVVDDVAEMMNFAIDPDHQEQGYGKDILNFVLNAFKDKNVKTITLEVRKSNKKAIHLYESYGFIQSHVRKQYYGNEDGIVYIKEVTP